MLESKMYKKLKKVINYAMFQRIETSTSVGVPDIIYAYQDSMSWMELKEISRRPKGNIVKIPWRPGQLAWYYNYSHKYKNEDAYILCLTIENSWYFIKDIKESYTKDELENYYLCETHEMALYRMELHRLLF